MLKTGLEFAPGTTEDSKKLVQQLPPDALINAYRTTRQACGSNDIVLMMSDQDPTIHGGTRMEYAAHLKRIFGARATAFRMCRESAHSIMRLPSEGDAFWLVIDIRGADVPIMCVLFATPYEIAAAAAN